MFNLFSETLKFDVATAAIKGGRAYQEDSLVAHFPLGQDTGFAVLADGMGGHMSGGVASALVTSDAFAKLKMNETEFENITLDIPKMLNDIAIAANDRITRHMQDDPETHGMGSTLLATVIKGQDLFWVSVGDSPLFLFRDGSLRQLNKDHSMAPQIDMMVKIGAMPAEVGRTHPDRNTLTSAIAGAPIEKIDCPTEPTTLKPGDIVIVASDGLQFLSNEKIESILHAMKSKHSVAITDTLLQAIDDLDDPNQDNTAFTVIKMCDLKHAVQEVDASMPIKTPAPTHTVRTVSIDPNPRIAEPAHDVKTPDPLVAQSAPVDPLILTHAVQHQPEALPRNTAHQQRVVAASPETRIVRLVASKGRKVEPKVAPVDVAQEPMKRQANSYGGQKYRND